LAANIVFASNIASKVLVPMDATQYARCNTSLLARVTEPTARTITGLMIQQSVYRICTSWSDPELYDPVAAAYLIDPSIATQVETLPLRIVLNGPGAGRTVVDHEAGSDVDVILAIDREQFISVLAHNAHRATWPFLQQQAMRAQ
jgi:inosine-uridine nucleoside N-ribohydrolase